MTKHKYRSFLYLDQPEVDDLLAQVEGGVTVGLLDESEKTSGLNNTDNTSETLEVRRQRTETPQVKFNRLYDTLCEDDDIAVLGPVDADVYQRLRPNDIVEVRGVARLPMWEHVKEGLAATNDLIPIMQLLGQDPLADQDAREALEGFNQLSSMKGQEDTMLILTAPGQLRVKFAAKLKASHLMRARTELEGEVAIVGIVRRRLDRDEEISASRVLPNLKGLETLNRAHRRQAAKSKASKLKTDTPLDEVVRYPAVEILPIAVFQ